MSRVFARILCAIDFSPGSRAALDLGIALALLGGWIGLVISLKLISLTIRRRSDGYQADPASCISCARCYVSCPIEQERLVKLGYQIPLMPAQAAAALAASGTAQRSKD